MSKQAITVRLYELLSERVWTGIQFGTNDIQGEVMDEEQITALQDKLHNEIMVALTEVIDFDAQAN
jgi:hypothetical protein